MNGFNFSTAIALLSLVTAPVFAFEIDVPAQKTKETLGVIHLSDLLVGDSARFGTYSTVCAEQDGLFAIGIADVETKTFGSFWKLTVLPGKKVQAEYINKDGKAADHRDIKKMLKRVMFSSPNCAALRQFSILTAGELFEIETINGKKTLSELMGAF